MSRRVAWAVGCWVAAPLSYVATVLAFPTDHLSLFVLSLLVPGVFAGAAVVNAHRSYVRREQARLSNALRGGLVLVAYVPLAAELVLLALAISVATDADFGR